MSNIKIYHKGQYYRLSSAPVSFAHLNFILTSNFHLECPSIFTLTSSKLPFNIQNESDFKKVLTETPSEFIFYTEEVPEFAFEYEDLNQSVFLSSSSEIFDIIREEIKQQHTKSNEKKQVRFEVKCANCGISPIVGVKYYCESCKINFCEACEEKGHEHLLLKLKSNKSIENNNQEVPKFGNIVFNSVKKMKELGFTDDKLIKNALTKAGYDVEIASNIIFDIE